MDSDLLKGPIEVLQSGLWGMGRALAVEHPELWGGLIDVDSGESEQARAGRIISELTSSDDEREVAWRDGVRLVPRLARWEGRRGEGIAVQCRADSSYLVTGGLSGLGLEAAKWLIEQGARRLIVAGRRGVPARTEWQRQEAGSEEWERVESLKELERMGAAIEYWSVDVSNEGAMRQLWEREEAEGRPPIRGIVHAAGVLDDVLAMRMSDESCLRVQEGKVKGALVLDELSRGRGLDFYIAYSSVSGVMGQVGQANYGAANAYLDGLMAKRRERGEEGLSIAWGPWSDVGLFARYDRAARADFAGVRAMTLREGKEILALASSFGSAQIVAINVDWTATERTKFTSLLAEDAPEDGAVASVMEPETFLLDVLLAEGAERRSLLESYLREMVSRVLKFDPERLNVRKPLTALGLDSIMAVEMKNSIQMTLNVSLLMVDFFTGSVADLVAKLESQLDGDGNLAELLHEVEMLPEARTDTSN
jgi:NAD(P)-dependent dehydrogenase (short-subunit alcohol dehydrogenase family)